MSLILLGILNSQAQSLGGVGKILDFSGDLLYELGQHNEAFTLDASGNIYLMGLDNTTSPFSSFLIKVSPELEVQWGRTVGDSVARLDPEFIKYNNYDDTLYFTSTDTSNDEAHLFIFDSDGTTLYNKYWGITFAGGTLNETVGIDFVDDQAVLFMLGGSSDQRAVWVYGDFLNDDANLGARNMYDPTYDITAYDVTIWGSSDAYGLAYNSEGGGNAIIIKRAALSTTYYGATEFTVTGATSRRPDRIIRNASGNRFHIFDARSAGDYVLKGEVATGSNSLNADWLKGINFGTGADDSCIYVDADDNVWVGTETSSVYYRFYKFNSSGVLQWQRELDMTPTGDSWTIEGIWADADNFHFVYRASSANSSGIIQLPADGSGIGDLSIYGSSCSYSEGTAVITDESHTSTTGQSLGQGISAISVSASSASIGTATYTPTLSNI